MVDLQVNGYAGVDLLTAPAEEWAVAGGAMARDGVTSYVANLITSPPPMLEAAAGCRPRGPWRRARAGARGVSGRTWRARSSRRTGAARTRPSTCATPT